ncbi:hypothetical protein Tco_1282915 [Tanacetum coccineum]
MDLNPSQPLVSTPVDTGMHKEDQQETGGLTSLGVTNEERANPQLSSGMLASNLNKPIYSASIIVHSESASRNDALAVSTAEADLENFAPSDFITQQQGMNEGTKITLYDHSFAGIDPHVLADQIKSVSEGLETVLTQPIIGKGASLVARQIEKETSSTIKLKDLAKLVSHVQPGFKDLDSPEDDPVIVVDDSDEDNDNEVHTTENVETKDTSVPKSSSPRSSQIQEITNQVLILQSQKHKLELEKNKAEAKAAFLKAQPSFPNVEQLNELLVKSLKTEFSNILSAYDFSSSLPTELKDLPSKFNELTEEVASVQAKLKTLDSLSGLLLNVTNALNKFVLVLDYASSKARDPSVLSAGQADIRLAEGEKDINQKIEEEAKAEAARRECEIRKEELIDLLGPEVVKKYYNDKLQYDKYCDQMLNRRAKSRITNCDILTRKGLITLKVYREDDTSEIIPEFKASDLHLGEWREVVTTSLNKTGKG